jgi:hypothetical protein
MPEKMNLYFGSASDTDRDQRDKDTKNWHEVDVATSEELIEFVNRGRQAGGADVLDALLPSRPLQPHACLIANALNFGCEVACQYDMKKGHILRWPSGAWIWRMTLPFNTPRAKTMLVAEAMDLPVVEDYHLGLPEHIGNAARAFDLQLAFQEFIDG